jgi:hypothetical protein
MDPTDPDDSKALIRRAAHAAVNAVAPASLPCRVDRKTGADLVTRFLFPVSHRTLEAWPLTWRRVNGKAVCETAELLAVAQAKLDAAAPIRGGRRTGGAEC